MIFKRGDVCQMIGISPTEMAVQQELEFYKLKWDGISKNVKQIVVPSCKSNPAMKINHLNKSDCSLLKIVTFLSQMFLIRAWFC
jgi:hypothetical protein